MAALFSETLRTLNGDSPNRTLFVWLPSGVLLVAWGLWFVLSSVDVYEETGRARLEAAQAPHGVDAPSAGQIDTLDLTVGVEVRAGATLARLDSGRERLRLKEEEARLARAAATVEHLRRQIDARERSAAEEERVADVAADIARQRGEETEAALELAQSTRARVEQLAEAGRTPRIEVPKVQAEVRKLTAERSAWQFEVLRLAREAAARSHRNRAEIEERRRELAAMEGEHAQSLAAIARLTDEIERRIVRAPISGRVGDVVPLRIGSYVTEGQRLATIVPGGELVVVADFSPQAAMGRIRPGQQARIRLDGFPWAQYGTIVATVTHVAGEIRDGMARVQLKIDRVPETGMRLQHGLPGGVEIIVEQSSPALLVLHAAGILLASAGQQRTAAPGAPR